MEPLLPHFQNCKISSLLECTLTRALVYTSLLTYSVDLMNNRSVGLRFERVLIGKDFRWTCSVWKSGQELEWPSRVYQSQGFAKHAVEMLRMYICAHVDLSNGALHHFEKIFELLRIVKTCCYQPIKLSNAPCDVMLLERRTRRNLLSHEFFPCVPLGTVWLAEYSKLKSLADGVRRRA